jgi:hypothetical protein
VVEDDRLAAAELAYQRALAALHEARADLSDLSAAQRRFSYDRVRLDHPTAAARAAELEAAHDRLVADVEQLRALAGTARAELRHLTDEPDSEPDEVPDEPTDAGFHQPPFDRPPFGAAS